MFHKLNLLYKSDRFPWIIISFGIIFRIVQYLHNFSLYIDEARDTVAGILGRSFSGLLGPPPDIFIPSPPLGFFVIEKLAVQFMGNSEYVLRLFPLIAGIVSLVLFYYTARQYIKGNAVTVALILFATLEPLIYYSSSVRPYSSDIAAALLVYMTAMYFHSNRLFFPRAVVFAAIGSVVIWFSSTSVFILAGAGATLGVCSVIRKEWQKAGALLMIYTCWLISFAFCYFLYLKNLTNAEWFVNTFGGEEAFAPFPPLSFFGIAWYIRSFFRVFDETVGISLSGIAAFAFITGGISIFSEKKDRFFILISPVVFVLLASSFYMYPFRHRMILFLVPPLLFFIAEGAEYIRDKTARHTPIIGTVLIGLLLFYPLLSAAHHLFKPVVQEEIKPAINYVRKHWQEGDVLYVHYRAHPVFEYYKKKYGFNDKDYIVGIYAGEKNNLWAFSVDYLNAYTDDLDHLHGKKRVWILFTETPVLKKGINEKVFFVYYLNTIGRQIDSFEGEGAAVYLYDLSEKAPHPVVKQRELHWNF
ncbi:MAG: glycosyltransferase family 39 protein [Nitrospirae bacterium]|nr:glycosyltransferase family 39 protein [Nitrospirota bacterium]